MKIKESKSNHTTIDKSKINFPFESKNFFSLSMADPSENVQCGHVKSRGLNGLSSIPKICFPRKFI